MRGAAGRTAAPSTWGICHSCTGFCCNLPRSYATQTRALPYRKVPFRSQANPSREDRSYRRTDLSIRTPSQGSGIRRWRSPRAPLITRSPSLSKYSYPPTLSSSSWEYSSLIAGDTSDSPQITGSDAPQAHGGIEFVSQANLSHFLGSLSQSIVSSVTSVRSIF